MSIFVKEKFCEELVKLESYKQRDFETALKEIFRKMDTIMLEAPGAERLAEISDSEKDNLFGRPGGEDENVAKFCGCTAVVVLMSDSHIICANAGDSRAVLGRSTGNQMCFPLSDDHKPDNAPEKARIEAAGGFVEENRVNGSLNLSRSLGDFEYKSNSALDYTQQMVTCDPEIRSVARQNADQFIILACDGIWDCLTSEECVIQTRDALGALDEAKPVASIIESMFDRIVAKDILSSAGVGTDNMTCIVIQLKPRA